MDKLSTTFAGLQLSSPIIVSSSGLTSKSHNLLRYEQAGAGALVLKSLFEEQIDSDIEHLYGGADSPEAMDYLMAYVRDNALENHLTLLREAKQVLSIPVIASINCFKKDSWISFAKEIEAAGADAIELNYMSIDTSFSSPYGAMETECIEMVDALCKQTKLPVIVKLPKYFSNIVRLVHDLKKVGAAGVVLFNRSYAMDIEVESMRVKSGNIFTRPEDIEDPLRYTALVHGAIPDMDVALSSGAHDTQGVLKGLLAGASAVQMCSSIYRDGEGLITHVLGELIRWMDRHKYYNIKEFMGHLSAKDDELSAMYLRTQFMKYYSNHKPN
ncbi:hypothetical protein HQ29_03860 [Porphyromonas canoris]|uniref:dihydrouracil dehydrogenase (NAD(+)) n=1 Tax=Porphyromonas canoris TaxID=36875 RepID=A0ABR4XJA2_9PORP|nr:dihydroorotate dehydrogenase-like protein [Porphyromonas canoris]KGL52794.1 hypothetical protein HQ29_03860 [Porphyromonas canoris]KGN91778.1 hypothetical protein HQ43_06710 [Porphyromonas canoris]